MKIINEKDIHPKDFADKSSKEKLATAIDYSLQIESPAVRLNTQSFNTKRYVAIGKLNDYDELKDRARAIKEYSIDNIESLIDKTKNAFEARGGKVFVAKSKSEAVEYVKNVCKSHNSKLIVKAKSITSEEIGLNHVLENENIEVAETDLAEFILQVSKEQPSHNVAPAIHRSRERITRLFKENFKTDKSLETGEQLTEFARDILRQKFLSADIGISGANFIAADTGTILLVESEGNIRLTTELPAIHIAIAGIEKIIPTKKDLGTFVELLAASATGQSLTSYTNILEPPLPLPIMNINGRDDKEREFHLVLVDNGRLKMRDDKDLKEALYCIRCSACMNVCANFQTLGGHAFGGECYVGGIGGAWTVGTSGSLQKARFADLCTGCSRCVPNCPVRIDIPRLNTTIKNRLINSGEPSLQKKFFGSFSTVAKFASLAPSISNWISKLSISKDIYESVIGYAKNRSIPEFAKKTLAVEYQSHVRRYEVKHPQNLILFNDVYTNYNNPQVGISLINVFEKLGFDISLSTLYEDGRAAQSQGLVESAQKSAFKLSGYLADLIEKGNDILFAEPSVLAMIRLDYKNLIHDDVVFKKLKSHCYDPIEYLRILIGAKIFKIEELSNLIDKTNSKLFYHGHCQMKSIGIGNETPEFFRSLGFDVDTSSVECCGMAGSFGYKKQYYDLSKNLGHELGQQIEKSKPEKSNYVILASGTSCREQIADEIGTHIQHPIEYLNSILRVK